MAGHSSKFRRPRQGVLPKGVRPVSFALLAKRVRPLFAEEPEPLTFRAMPSRLPLVALVALGACGDNESGLENYFPDLPPPTGGAQEVFAGQVTDPSQLVDGPARSGLVGDFFITNDRVTFIVQ